MARTMRAAIAAALFTFGALVVGVAPSGGASTPVTAAAAWLRSQQQPDGGFEVAGFPGLETPEAVFALGSAGQTGSSWNAALARAAVLSTSTAPGRTPLDLVDDFADSGISKGQAGKLIALVTNPLGLDPASFDPTGDGPIDLVDHLGDPGVDHTWGIALASFNDILYAIRGYALAHGSVPSETIDVVRAAQKSDGSWSFDGLSGGSDGGADTTGLAVQALRDAGVAASDPDVDEALDYLEAGQLPGGGWDDGFTENPNSTAVAMLGLAAGGRTAPLAAADQYLLGLQQADGRIAGPYDTVPPNTFATSQSIEALVRIPVPRATSFAAPVTVPAAIGGGALSIETSAGTLADVVAVDPSTLPPAPDGATFPHGLLSFRIIDLDPGASVDVTVTLPFGAVVDRYDKLVHGSWSTLSGVTIFNSSMTLTLVDGGARDADGTQDGVIVDPGGAARTGDVASSPAPPPVLLDPTFTG